jgi:hypothetical protein
LPGGRQHYGQHETKGAQRRCAKSLTGVLPIDMDISHRKLVLEEVRNSRKFEMLDLDRNLPGPGDASRAAHHAHHELDRLLVAQILRAHHRAPRLEVQGEPYGTEQ